MIVEQLTRNERFFLWRKRAKITQRQVAKTENVSLYRVQMWEKGVGLPPEKEITHIEPHEQFVIYRMRAGMTQRDLAKRMGMSIKWVWKMENGLAPLDRLVQFWS